MSKKQACMWLTVLALLLVLVPAAVNELQKSHKKISTLEQALHEEKASHEKDIANLKAAQETVEKQVLDIESVKGELSIAKEEAERAKQDAAAAKEEVERLKKVKASAVKKPPVDVANTQQQAAPTQKAEKPSGNGGRKVTFVVTAYGADCAGCQGKTASGTDYVKGRTIAAPPQYAFGTKIEIPELGGTFTVEDRGGDIQGNRLDLFYGSESESSSFGVRVVEGYVYD